MKTIYNSVLLLIMLFTVACSNERSLQKYYVENQNNENFVVIDIPASLFLESSPAISEEDQKALKSIKKANVLAYPVTGSNQEEYEAEKTEIQTILSSEKYKLLMKFGASGRNVKLMYLGEKEAIDEIIVYGNDSEKGFAVARILGKKMNPNAIIKLMKSAGNGHVDVKMEEFEKFSDLFENINTKQ